jgi:hypothetical protein
VALVISAFYYCIKYSILICLINYLTILLWDKDAIVLLLFFVLF